KLKDKTMIAYNYVSLRSLGDQPGRWTARYLSSWKTLPDGVMIAPEKFGPRRLQVLPDITNNVGSQVLVMKVFGFSQTNNIPFPSEETSPAAGKAPYITVPYIGFNYLGQFIGQSIGQSIPSQSELIP